MSKTVVNDATHDVVVAVIDLKEKSGKSTDRWLLEIALWQGLKKLKKIQLLIIVAQLLFAIGNSCQGVEDDFQKET